MEIAALVALQPKVQVFVGGLVDTVVSNEPNDAFGIFVGLAIAETLPRWAKGRFKASPNPDTVY